MSAPATPVAVFFYGLFMDAELLAGKGLTPSRTTPARLDGFTLRIGERATLLPDPDGEAWGMLMLLPADQLEALYSEASVSDYVPETVTVHLADGAAIPARCYNLPIDQLTGTNPQYTRALHDLCKRLGFPDDYMQHITSQVSQGH